MIDSQSRIKKERGVYNRWLYLILHGVSLLSHDKLKNKDIAVYGLGDLGRRLVDEMQLEGVAPLFIVDRKADTFFLDVPVLFPGKEMPKADSIVVTVINEYEEIKKSMSSLFDGEIVSLEEIVDNLWTKHIDSEVMCGVYTYGCRKI